MESIEHPEQLTYCNGVPFVVWCYWEGEKMHGNRLISFEYLKENIGVPLCLVTPQNISLFIKNTHPLHPAYKNLSIVHRSDYLRAYFLHHYGGAWHDIKATKASFKNVWNEFANEHIWMVGRPETRSGAAKTYTTDQKYIPDFYQYLISVTAWVGRPNTALSKEVLEGIEFIINSNADLLKKYPATHAREKKIETKNWLKLFFVYMKFFYQKRSLHYPIEWTLFGNIFHPLILKYNKHISFKLPCDVEKNAGVNHRG